MGSNRNTDRRSKYIRIYRAARLTRQMAERLIVDVQKQPKSFDETKSLLKKTHTRRGDIRDAFDDTWCGRRFLS